MLLQGGQTRVTRYAQRCCKPGVARCCVEMLRSFGRAFKHSANVFRMILLAFTGNKIIRECRLNEIASTLILRAAVLHIIHMSMPSSQYSDSELQLTLSFPRSESQFS